MTSTTLRDDNLQLIFAGVQEKMLSEKLADIRLGACAAIGFAVLCWSGTAVMVNVPEIRALNVPWLMAVEMIFGLGAMASVFLPLVLAMLYVERTRIRRQLAEHQALLEKYNRA